MRTNKNKIVALVLALALSVGLLTSAAAYDTAGFFDVAASHWAYSAIMEMADKGIIKGIGGDKFAPAEELTVASLLALVGRALYPAECNEAGTSIWWETYYRTAVTKGIVLGSELVGMASVMDRSITRNEMARIMIRVDENINGNPKVLTDTSKITDYASIPAEFQYSAEQAFAKGLLTGDEDGNFNGADSFSRAEAATVMTRLLTAQETGEMRLEISHTEANLSYENRNIWLAVTGETGYLTWTTSDASVATVGGGYKGAYATALGIGSCTITVVDEEGKSASCIINSTFAYPEPPPRTGEMVTITFHGMVSFFDHMKPSAASGLHFPSGIQMTMKTEDGRVLGTTVSYEVEIGEDGYPVKPNYTMVATFDKADLKLDQIEKKAFFMECTYIDENGVRYSTISKNLMRGSGFWLYSDNIHQVSPYDFRGSTIDFILDAGDIRFLDF